MLGESSDTQSAKTAVSRFSDNAGCSLSLVDSTVVRHAPLRCTFDHAGETQLPVAVSATRAPHSGPTIFRIGTPTMKS